MLPRQYHFSRNKRSAQAKGALLADCFKALWLSGLHRHEQGFFTYTQTASVGSACTVSQAVSNSAKTILLDVQCATLSLKPYQTQAKHSLTVPIAAGCIMMEFAHFWENLSASSAEVLQCPRCSQVVAHPQGYCRYCKENAYQCRHCRYRLPAPVRSLLVSKLRTHLCHLLFGTVMHK